MTTLIQNLYKQAQLAAVCYGLQLSNDSIESDLVRYTNEIKMASAEADLFCARELSLIARYPENEEEASAAWGAAMDLFKDSEGKLYLAVRGTETKASDFSADGILAIPGVDVLNPQYNRLVEQVQKWATSQNGEPPLLTGDVTITGHSLGGYLAGQLKQQFDELTSATGSFRISQAYVYNAPGQGGIWGSVTRVLPWVDTLLADPDIIRVSSSGMSVTEAVGVINGARIPLVTERGNIPDNHRISRITSTLAVMAAYEKLLGEQADITLLNQIADASGVNKGVEPNEFLNVLVRLVKGSSAPMATDDRQSLFLTVTEVEKAIIALGSSAKQCYSFIGVPAATMADYAAEAGSRGEAARRALQELTPIGIAGAAGLPKVMAYDAAPPRYWHDRALMLDNLLFYAQHDVAADNGAAAALLADTPDRLTDATEYYDGVTESKVAYGKTDNKVGFAKPGQLMQGTSYADRLYGADGATLVGGEGADVLVALGDNCVLEGGAGNDEYVTQQWTVIKDQDRAGLIRLAGGPVAYGGTWSAASHAWIGAQGEEYARRGMALEVRYNETTAYVQDYFSSESRTALGLTLTGGPSKEELFEHNSVATVLDALLVRANLCGTTYPGLGSSGPWGWSSPSLPGYKWNLLSRQLDPLALDLNGDGVVSCTSRTEGVYFDHDANGFAEKTGWLSATDGFLVRDLNQNGAVDSGRELFGDQTELTSGGTAANGYAALADLDTNGDSVLDEADVTWSSLQIWQDLDRDGIASASELKSLTQAGVTALALDFVPTATRITGNTQIGQSTFQRADGSIGVTAAFNFEVSVADSQSTTTVGQLPESVTVLPNVRGFGVVASLHQVMAQNEGLTLFVAQVAGITEFTQLNPLFDELLSRWAGVTGVVAGTRGEFIDAQHLAVVEAFSGTPFFNQAAGSANPSSETASVLEAAYQSIKDRVKADFLVQAQLAPYWSAVSLDWDVEANKYVADYAKVPELLQEGSVVTASELVKVDEFVTAARLLGVADGASFESWRASLKARWPETDLLIHANLNGGTLALGSDGMDNQSLSQSGVLLGLGGNDTLIVGASTENVVEVDGGIGDDTITVADNYRTTIHFGLNSGHDELSLQGGFSTVALGSGVQKTWTAVAQQGQDLLLALQDGSSMRIKDWFDLSANHQLGFTQFADGTMWNPETGYNVVDNISLGGATADTLAGTAGRDYLVGGEGADLLTGGAGADTLIGGTGNDTLGGVTVEDTGVANGVFDGTKGAGGNRYYGGRGNDVLRGTALADTYQFDLGDGQDTITEVFATAGQPGDQVDVLQFGDGILAADMRVTRTGADLVLQHQNGTDRVTVTNWYGAEGAKVEQVQFKDGTTWSAEMLTAQGLVVHGTAADDVLTGIGSYADALYGEAGNDNLAGNPGDDLLDGGAGDDILNGGSGNDVLLGGEGNDDLKGFVGNDIVDGGSGNDLVNGGAGMDILRGGDGDDSLGSIDSSETGVQGGVFSASWGAAGNQYYGGRGNDTLRGTALGDTYHFDRGDGTDVITETYATSGQPTGQQDVLQFGPDILVEEVAVSREGYNLVFTLLTNPTDKVVVANWYANEGQRLEQVRFADGTVWQEPALTARGLVVEGGAGDDTISGIGNYDDILIGGDGNDTISGLNGNDTLDGGNGNDILNGGSGHDHLYGGNDNDTLAGLLGDDYMEGGAGDDSLNGGGGADILKGGDGNDTLGSIDSTETGIAGGVFSSTYGANANQYYGGRGDDFMRGSVFGDGYHFAQGDGHDTIAESFATTGQPAGQQDILWFEDGVLEENVAVGKVSNNLVLSDITTGDQVTVNSWFTNEGFRLEQVRFDSGAVWTEQLLTAMGLASSGTGGNDAITGLAGRNNVLRGKAGNDVLQGAAGSDLLDGGAGDDTLIGGAGDDVLIGGAGADNLTVSATTVAVLFNRGDGADRVTGRWGAQTLSFGGGIVASDISLSRTGNDLVVCAEEGDSVTLAEWFGGASSGLLQIAGINGNGEPIVQVLDLGGYASQFALAQEVDPTLSTYSLLPHLESHLLFETAEGLAGGDIAYRYATTGSLTGMGLPVVMDTLATVTPGGLTAITPGATADATNLLKLG